MNDKRIFLVTDLGPGDGGKGGVVHKICCEMKAHTVLKVGGAQGSHGVRTSRGESFNFSQFGCGTFEGVRTHILNLMVINPLGILTEGESLRYEHGITNAFDLLTVDRDCLCRTPFHGIASRLRELARKGDPKGTIGVGIGETQIDSELHPDLAIYARNLGDSNLRSRLEAVRDQKMRELAELLADPARFLPEDRELAQKDIDCFQNPRFVDWILDELKKFKQRVKVVGTDYLEKEILSQPGTAVIESSHGVLTDRYHGFHPYTSRLRTLPRRSTALLRERGYDGQVIHLGVSRGYQIRHGAGPLVTQSTRLLENLLPGSSKHENRWQGKVRVGALDLVVLRYSIDVCGGPEAFDGLAITWFDQIQTMGNWEVCHKYEHADDQTFFSSPSTIKVRFGEDEKQIAHQRELAKRLFKCRPVITSESIGEGRDREFATEKCSNVLQGSLGVPVKMISFGSTENDKVLL